MIPSFEAHQQKRREFLRTSGWLYRVLRGLGMLHEGNMDTLLDDLRALHKDMGEAFACIHDALDRIERKLDGSDDKEDER